MTNITDKGGYLRACGAMGETHQFGIDVSHALAMSVENPAQSYYIRVVYADQECYVNDLIRELLVGDVSSWAHEVAVQHPKTPIRAEPGFLRNLLAVLIDERTTQRCRDCNGTGAKGQLVGERYKGQRVKVMDCPTCGGEGVKRRGDKERARSLGLDEKIYKRHWKALCERVDARFTEWDDQVNRVGRYRLWAN